MPIYEFQCDTCGAHFERRQAFGDASCASLPQRPQRRPPGLQRAGHRLQRIRLVRDRQPQVQPIASSD